MLNRLKSIFRAIDRCHGLFGRWIFGGDVTYALLPLIIMVIVAVICPRPEEHFRGLKEWSFAAIIFFGVAIQKFISFKVRVQQAGNSHKLGMGVQMYIVFLIVAVLVLACVVLAERGVFPPAALPLLEKAQIAMFALGAFTTLIATVAESEPQLFSYKFDNSRESCLHRVAHNLGEACEDLDRALYWAEHANSAKETPSNDAIADRREREGQAGVLVDSLQRVQRLVDEARRMIPSVVDRKNAIDSHRPPVS